jgi:uncharacterized protein YbjT (DUF2867 family)
MTRVLVTGGTGELGSAVVRTLLERGDPAVRVMSRRDRQPADPAAIEWVRADLETGAGLAEAVAGVDVIVHAASGTGPHPGEQSAAGLWAHSEAVDVQGTRRLLECARDAGVRHVVYISIVGVDRVRYFYYRRKLAAEELLRESDLPWTILRATQFHSLIATALHALARWPVLPLPADFRFQPVAASEVAVRLCACAAAGPAGRVPDYGGPEIRTLGDLAAAWLRARGRERPIIRLPLPGRLAAVVREGALTSPDHRDGTITWEAWLRDHLPAKSR